MRLIVSMLAALALAACAGTTMEVETEEDIEVTESAAAGCIDNADWAYAANRGSFVYREYCDYCHQADGTGQPGKVPRLSGNQTVLSDPDSGIRLILVTKSPATRRHGMRFEDMTAMFGELSHANIADVMTYVRSSWENCTGPVSEAQVKAVAAAM